MYNISVLVCRLHERWKERPRSLEKVTTYKGYFFVIRYTKSFSLPRPSKVQTELLQQDLIQGFPPCSRYLVLLRQK